MPPYGSLTELFLTITAFSGRIRFSSVQKTRLARGARNGSAPPSTNAARYPDGQRPKNLRGREAVRADRRWRADDEAIRTPSAILCEDNPKPALPLIITAFFARMLFMRAENVVGARSAQSRQVELKRMSLRGRRPVRADHRLRTDEKPSARNRRSCIKTIPSSRCFQP